MECGNCTTLKGYLIPLNHIIKDGEDARPVIVAHTCNCSYKGGRDQEYCSSRTDLAKS
jgi:hypothetical protein